ncbi:hypothetical protein HmCmsJML035_00304 [Escherichia coli]|nr:hypothetical protein HmCmsJML035_00304 [Escherichia coli]GCY16817.1 hypothetical protein HmCmsJML077_04249 [Escherichia coli]
MTVSSRKDKNIPTPHDATFRAFMASAEVASDFVALHLSAEYRQLCDLSTLQLVQTVHLYSLDIEVV